MLSHILKKSQSPFFFISSTDIGRDKGNTHVLPSANKSISNGYAVLEFIPLSSDIDSSSSRRSYFAVIRDLYSTNGTHGNLQHQWFNCTHKLHLLRYHNYHNITQSMESRCLHQQPSCCRITMWFDLDKTLDSSCVISPLLRVLPRKFQTSPCSWGITTDRDSEVRAYHKREFRQRWPPTSSSRNPASGISTHIDNARTNWRQQRPLQSCFDAHIIMLQHLKWFVEWSCKRMSQLICQTLLSG